MMLARWDFKAKTKFEYDALLEWWNRPGRRSQVIAYATKACLVEGDNPHFNISHHGDPICRIYPNHVEIGTAHPYLTTRYRLGRAVKNVSDKWMVWGSCTGHSCGLFMTYGSWGQNDVPKISWECVRKGRKCWGPTGNSADYHFTRNFHFEIHAGKDFSTTFRPTISDVWLNLGCHLGDCRAADTLIKNLEARGETAIASIVRQHRGERYGCHGCFRDYTRQYRSLQEQSYATEEQLKPGPLVPDTDQYAAPGAMKHGPSLADQGISSGLWLADEYAHGGPLFGIGDLVRSLSMWDVLIEGINPKEGGTVVIEGKSLKVVNGATYHDKVRANWHLRGGIKPRRLKIKKAA